MSSEGGGEALPSIKRWATEGARHFRPGFLIIKGTDSKRVDTDGDTFKDDVEYKYGSTLSGKESGIPCMIKTIDPSTKWKDRYYKGVWVGWKLVSYIDVDVLGSDPAGVKDIYVKVSSSNRLSSKEKSKTIVGNDFEHEFKFDFKLDSMITEIWSGWHVYIKVTDINENWGYQEEHIKSGVQRLIDWLAENLGALFDMILQWLYDRVRSMVKKALEPIKEAIDSWKNGFIRAITNFQLEFNNREVTQQTKDELMNYLYGPLFFTIGVFSAVTIAAITITEIISLGSATAISTVVGIVISIALNYFDGSECDLGIDFSFGINPIISAGEAVIEWIKDKAEFQNNLTAIFSMTCDMFASIAGGAAIAAESDNSGLLPAWLAIICGIMSGVFSFLSIMIPIVWLIGLLFGFLAIGFGAWATYRSTLGTPRNCGYVAMTLGISSVSVNTVNLI